MFGFVWLLSVFLLFNDVTVCIVFSLSSVGFCKFCFSTDHHGIYKEFRVEWMKNVVEGRGEKELRIRPREARVVD